MLKKTLVAGVVALAFAGTASASNGYIGGGAYDMGVDTNFYVTGGFKFTDHLVGHFDYIDELDYVVRAHAEYKYNYDFGGYVGVAHYDYGFGDETGFVVGASYALQSDAGTTRFFLQHETSFDGFQSVGVRHTYSFNHQWALDLGYRINTDDMDNEYNIGILFKF